MLPQFENAMLTLLLESGDTVEDVTRLIELFAGHEQSNSPYPQEQVVEQGQNYLIVVTPAGKRPCFQFVVPKETGIDAHLRALCSAYVIKEN